MAESRAPALEGIGTAPAASALPASRLAQFYRGRDVLVTGSSGLLGHWVMALLAACGATPTGMARHPAAQGAACPTYHADVRDAEAVSAAVEASRASVILHLAAQSRTRAGQSRRTYETNILGTVNVLDAAAAHGVASCVVTASSRDPSAAASDQAFFDPYNASKLAAEQVALGYRADALRSNPVRGVAIARPAVLVGGGDLTPGRLVPDLMSRLRRGEAPQPATPTQYRPWQHAVETAVGVLWLGAQLAADPERLGAAFNFGFADSLPPTSAGSVTARLTAIWRDQELACPEASPPVEGFWLDDDRACRELGWEACWSLDRTLKAVVDWYRAYAVGPDTAFAETMAQVTRYAADAATAGRVWAVPSGTVDFRASG